MATSPAGSSSGSQEHQQVHAVARKIPHCMPGVPARWFFAVEDLRNKNPSLISGIDLDKELYYRQQAASFIHDMGIKLQLSQLVMNVALVYMHRFYVFHSFKRFQRHDLAAAAVFLAAKAEEMPRKLEYIVKVSYALQHRDEPTLDVKSEKYAEEAQKIITYENILLQTLGFDLQVEVPHPYVVKCIQMVKAPRELAQAAYHFTTDCLHLTTLCLRYRPSVVACACIFLACSWAKWEIPTSHEGKPWYYYVDKDVTREILEALAEEIVSVYQRCPERLKIKRYLGVKRGEEGSTNVQAEYNGLLDPEARELLQSPDFGASQSMLNHTTKNVKTSVKPENPPNSKMPPSSLRNEMATASPSSSTTAQGRNDESSPKKVKVEIAKVDLKLYKERMKERQQEQPNEDPSQRQTVRKSFIPDVSSVKSEWLLGDKVEPKKNTDSQRQHSRSAQLPPHSDHRNRHRPVANGASDASDSDRRQQTAQSHSHQYHQSGSASSNHVSGSTLKRPHDGSDNHSNSHKKMMKVEHSVDPSSMNGLSKSDKFSKPAAVEKQSHSNNSTAHERRERDAFGHDDLIGDEVLKRAKHKAEQMQKLEKLEKLKNMKFVDLMANPKPQPPLPSELPPPPPPPPQA